MGRDVVWRAALPSKKFFSSCHKTALPDDIPYRRTSAGAEETGGFAMAGRRKRTPLIGVGLVAIAAAALLFLGVWMQADRADRWAEEPAQVRTASCQNLFWTLWPDFA